MRKSVKIALIIAGCMIVLGGGVLTVLGIGMSAGRIALPKAERLPGDIVTRQEHTLPVTPDGTVRVRVLTDDVTVDVSPDENVHIVCYDTSFVQNEIESSPNTVELTQSVLSQTKLPDLKRWILEWNVDTGVEVLLPASFRGELILNITTGDLEIKGVQTSLLSASSTTGEIAVSDISCTGNAAISALTGRIEVSSASVTDALTVTTTTGDARLSDTTAGSLERRASNGHTELKDVKTDSLFIVATTGDVTFSRLETDSANVVLTTGSIRGTLLGTEAAYQGKLNFKTTTGDVRISYQ